jgi:hypothetical protein
MNQGISPEALAEVEAVSAANAERERPRKHTFVLTVDMNTEAFGDDQWDRELELGRILREMSMLACGGILPQVGEVRDRHYNTVGRFEFKEE